MDGTWRILIWMGAGGHGEQALGGHTHGGGRGSGVGGEGRRGEWDGAKNGLRGRGGARTEAEGSSGEAGDGAGGGVGARGVGALGRGRREGRESESESESESDEGLSGWGGGRKGGMGLEVKLGNQSTARVGVGTGRRWAGRRRRSGREWAAARRMGGATWEGRICYGVAMWGHGWQAAWVGGHGGALGTGRALMDSIGTRVGMATRDGWMAEGLDGWIRLAGAEWWDTIGIGMGWRRIAGSMKCGLGHWTWASDEDLGEDEDGRLVGGVRGVEGAGSGMGVWDGFGEEEDVGGVGSGRRDGAVGWMVGGEGLVSCMRKDGRGSDWGYGGWRWEAGEN